MKRWLVLALLGLAVIWGPYVYSELSSSPVHARGRHRVGLHLFGDDDEDQAQPEAEDLAAEADKGVEDEKTDDKPGDAPADKSADKPADDQANPTAAKDPAKAEGEDKLGGAQDKPENAAREPERPTLPSDLLPGFRKVFDAEPRDAFWANDEAPHVRALFTEFGATPDTLAEVLCRTTVCRVVFTPDELETEALGKLYAALHVRYPDAVALDYKAEPPGQRATLYVLRAGYKLEH